MRPFCKRILTTGNMSGDGDKFCNAAELFNIAEKNNENQRCLNGNSTLKNLIRRSNVSKMSVLAHRHFL